jgi:hypothetical protein
MSIHPDIKKAIEIIDQRIEALRNVRESLAREFGMEDMVKPSVSAISSQPPLRQTTISLIPVESRRTRKDQVEEYLKQHGPSRRKEIAEGLGVPEGTVSYVLNDKERFANVEHGKWDLVSQEESA